MLRVHSLILIHSSWCPNMKQILTMKQIPAYHFHSTYTCRQQRGFTLVEVLVAITIGLLMMAGILQISEASKESSRLQRNMGFVQENIRTAMELLSRDIRQAGFYTDDDPDARILNAPSPFVGASAPTTATTVAITADGGGANNDQISYIYDAVGTKWLKKHNDGSLAETMYAGAFVYEDTGGDGEQNSLGLDYILHGEADLITRMSKVTRCKCFILNLTRLRNT